MRETHARAARQGDVRASPPELGRVGPLQSRSLHADLITLRRSDRAFNQQTAGAIDGAVLAQEAFVLRYTTPDAADERLLLVNLGRDLVTPSFAEPLLAPPQECEWRVSWSSESSIYGGCGTPTVLQSGWRIPGHAALVLKPERRDVGHGTR